MDKPLFRRALLSVLLLFLSLALSPLARAQYGPPGPPSIRGFVIGATLIQFRNAGYTDGSGNPLPSGYFNPFPNGAPWTFGYRPDVPQLAGAEQPVTYGPNG